MRCVSVLLQIGCGSRGRTLFTEKFFGLMKIWSAKCDVRVFSEKMKKASIHREIEYVVFMKSNIFASSQWPRARAHNPDAIDENFRCNTVDLPHRGILVGFFF